MQRRGGCSYLETFSVEILSVILQVCLQQFIPCGPSSGWIWCLLEWRLSIGWWKQKGFLQLAILGGESILVASSIFALCAKSMERQSIILLCIVRFLLAFGIIFSTCVTQDSASQLPLLDMTIARRASPFHGCNLLIWKSIPFYYPQTI